MMVFGFGLVARGQQVTVNNSLPDPLGTGTFQGLFDALITWVLGIVGLLAVAMIVYGGFLYMISAGEQTKIEQAKKTITYAIIGSIIVIGSYAILEVITRVFTQ